MKVKLHCTDKAVDVEADVLSHKKGVFLEVAMNTVKVRLNYQNGVYVASKAGLEFVVREENIPSQHRKEWSR